MASMAAERTLYRQLYRTLSRLQRHDAKALSSLAITRNLFGHCVAPSTVQSALQQTGCRKGHRKQVRTKAVGGEVQPTVPQLMRMFISMTQGRDSTYKLQQGLSLLRALNEADEVEAKIEPLRTIFCNIAKPEDATAMVVPTLVNDGAFSRRLECNPFFTKHHHSEHPLPFAMELLMAEVLQHTNVHLGELLRLSPRELCQKLPRRTTTTDNVAEVIVETSYVGHSTVAQPPPEVFQYHITIANVSKDVTFRLLSRRWAFHDPIKGVVHEVVGPGVVGNFPLLRPGEKYEYNSGTTLSHDCGYMHGEFQLATATGQDSKVDLHHAVIRATGLTPFHQ